MDNNKETILAEIFAAEEAKRVAEHTLKQKLHEFRQHNGPQFEHNNEQFQIRVRGNDIYMVRLRHNRSEIMQAAWKRRKQARAEAMGLPHSVSEVSAAPEASNAVEVWEPIPSGSDVLIIE